MILPALTRDFSNPFCKGNTTRQKKEENLTAPVHDTYKTRLVPCTVSGNSRRNGHRIVEIKGPTNIHKVFRTKVVGKICWLLNFQLFPCNSLISSIFILLLVTMASTNPTEHWNRLQEVLGLATTVRKNLRPTIVKPKAHFTSVYLTISNWSIYCTRSSSSIVDAFSSTLVELDLNNANHGHSDR